MPLTSEQQELANLLLSGTLTGVLDWTATPERDVYRLTLDGGGLIRFSRSSAGEFGLLVFNREGEMISPTELYAPGEAPELAQLFDAVKTSLGRGQDFRNILKELQEKLTRR